MRTDAQLSYYSIPKWVRCLNKDNAYCADRNDTRVLFDGIWYKLKDGENGTKIFTYIKYINVKGKPVRHETEITVIL